MDDVELKSKLAELPGDRVSVEDIVRKIVSEDYVDRPIWAQTLTICNLTLDNGYSVRGESACVDAVNYREDIGRKLAYDDAFRKLWPLFGFGFLLAEGRYQRAQHGVRPE